MLSLKPEHKTHKCDRIRWERVWCRGDWTWKEPRNLNGSPCSATHSLPSWVQIRHLPPLVLIFLICKMKESLKIFFNKKMWDSLIICGYSVFSKTELVVGLPLWPDPLLHYLSHRQQKGAMEKRVNLKNCVCSNGSCWVRTGGAPLYSPWSVIGGSYAVEFCVTPIMPFFIWVIPCWLFAGRMTLLTLWRFVRNELVLGPDFNFVSFEKRRIN